MTHTTVLKGLSETAAARRTLAARLIRDEDGSMLLFGLYLFMGIMLIGGISVDIMRNEYTRLRLQNTVDTAVLAAADLDQRLDPRAVVTDYFDKAGMAGYLGTINVVESINSRTVTATSSVDVGTLFVNTLGVDSLAARALGTAREEISDIEIAMVLDVSGSMGWGTRLGEMKQAATNFVNTVLSDERSVAGEGEVSVSIVPYSTQVNIGKTVTDQMDLSYRQDYSHCVDFESGDFSTTALPGANRNQTGHFDPWTRTSPPAAFVCRNDPAFQVHPLGGNKAALLAQIAALTPGGNTSTDVGLKWGAALLDPSFRTITDDLIAAGEVAADFADRPFDFNRPNTMKVLVVMTDGAHTNQYMLRNEFNAGLSDVWGRQYSDGSWRFSVDHQEYGNEDGDSTKWEDWYWARTDSWSNSRDGGNSNTRQLSYQELWNAASLGYNAYYMWYRQNDNASLYWDWYRNNTRTYVGAWEKDRRMRMICAEAKAKGILVFSVAFEIDESDAPLMKECASSENHYFEVNGNDIVYAFSAIASTINQLRLIQ
ncbi:MAG: hypothetical protein GW905_06245 [Rhodobacterales bacterium]|nr:hypothetical protein [Rhodobacterales bacterium]